LVTWQTKRKVNTHLPLGKPTIMMKWSICTLEMPNDKSTLTPNHLPVQVCGVIWYKRSGTIRYRLCSKDGILKATYGREQLTPAPQHTAQGLGIFYHKLDKKQIITMTEAGEKYCPAGGKFSHCHCKNDCSLSKTFKCRKANKFCNQHCHKGNGYNTFCRNCPPITTLT